MPHTGTEVTVEWLQAFADAFNRHDVDAIMSFMTDDCAFEHPPDRTSAVSVLEWVFTGTRADGTRVEVNGCDLFSFRDGRIAVKNSYRKNRAPVR